MDGNSRNLLENDNENKITENENSAKKLNSTVGKTIATKIPLNTYDELNYLINNGAYLSISDFLRESIREELKKYKISKVENIDYNEAKKEVISYFNKFGEAYLDDLALNLDLDFIILSNIIDNLLNEGRIKRTLISNDIEKIDSNTNFIKLSGRRLIVEARNINSQYLRLESTSLVNIKKKGFILDNGIAIISNHYTYIK